MEYAKFTTDNLTINTKSQREQYRQIKGEVKTVVHWGQRKLLLSEIEFFSVYLSKEIENPICVYAGAAHGNHLPLLSAMFPSLTFHLYDPSKFNITEDDKIKIFNEYFTDEIAKMYNTGKNNIFFLCDIRRTGYKELTNKYLAERGIVKFDKEGNPIGPPDLIKEAQKLGQAEHERDVWEDMEMQQQWVLLINPLHSLLKFKLPYPLQDKNNIPIDRKIKYLKGTVFWQQWGPPTTAETRLKPIKNIDGKYEVADWSVLEYEEWCFYQNYIIREKTKFLNTFTNEEEPLDYPELLNDYDSTAEVEILRMYLRSFNTEDNKQNTLKLSKLITLELNNYGKSLNLENRRLTTKTFDPFSKNKIPTKQPLKQLPSTRSIIPLKKLP